MKRFFAAIILILIALPALCIVALIACAGWLLVLDGDSRNRLVTEVGVNPAWKNPQFILIQTGIPLVWLACVIICFLKNKPGSAIVGIAAGVAQEIGLPPIGGYYILNLLYPLAYCRSLGRSDLRARNLITPIGFIDAIFTNTGAQSRNSE
jgi:hypothetical protein